MNAKIGICTFVCATVLATRAHGELIATYDSAWSTGAIGVFDWITGNTYLSEEFAVFEGLGTLFEEIVVYAGETRVDTIAEGDDPDFGVYGELLTDGIDWWLYDQAQYAGGIFGSTTAFHLESLRLEFTDPDHEGVDLAGYTIESVTRTITVLLDSPGSDPNGDGIWTDIDISTVFEIYGTIPEPSSLVVLAIGAGGLLLRHRARGRIPR